MIKFQHQEHAQTSIDKLPLIHHMPNVITYQWRKAKIPPYKHAIVAYGAAIAGLPSQIAHGIWQKIRNTIWSWWPRCHHLTTMSMPQT
ncbi:hypothetical protein HKD37_11G030788 [Glycine soja]